MISDAERQVRIDLAACYRLVAHFGWDDMIFTHISARVPGPDAHFLINPFGLLFEEMTASSLLKVNLAGELIDKSDHVFNPAGFVVHSAVHAVRHDAGCVLHLHSTCGAAVAAQAEGLLPLTQHAMVFHGKLAYHSYEGIALELDERARLQADLGTKHAMILRSHGTLTVGATVAEAFQRMYWLERACAAQVAALAGDVKSRAIVIPSREVCERTAEQGELVWAQGSQLAWPGLLRLLDRRDTSYRS
jgi:ribulose-5-phosphate 4-epimerase/fuculose-1-phosphate aldolase